MQPNKEAREALLHEINDVSEENLNQKPVEGQWSIKQIVEHLFLMEGMIVKMVENQLENGKEVKVEQKPIELTVDRRQKVEAPDFARPSDDFETPEEIQLKLETSRRAFLKLMETVDEQDLKRKAFQHPVFGEMSLQQWLPFIGWHEKRHIEQIREVKEALQLRS